NRIIQKYAPGQVGRYNDDFEPRAFGDNIQKWGTRTILIESGGYPEDVEKQEIRKLNYVSILSAIYTIAKGNYKELPLEEYEKIPENDRKLFDLKIEKVTYELMGNNYILDLGIHRLEVEKEDDSNFWYSSRIIDQGDLSTYYGYEDFNAEGYTVKQGGIYPEVLENMQELEQLDFADVLRSGFNYVRVANIPEKALNSPFPINVVGKNFELPDFKLEVGGNPSFLLQKDGEYKYALVNGFLLDLNDGNKKINFDFSHKNGMIYR
ncbi:MAG: peptidase M14, partial [Gramella sp.]|nr:peptidase M14 [Christiangramia sp.]